MNFGGSTVLITGGTGFLGTHLVHHLCQKQQPRRVIVFSRDAHKQDALLRYGYDELRCFVGDVRDLDRLRLAFDGVDYVIHAAAIKNVWTGEYNVWETVQTNVTGTMNVCRAAAESGVKRVVFISSDKAVDPVNTYGGTKFMGERIVLRENYVKPMFSVVRYGNVMGSTGSVLERYREILDSGKKELPLTDEKMNRFWVDPGDAIKLIERSFEREPGCVTVGKHPSFYIRQLGRALSRRSEFKIIGIRPGEKLGETLIGDSEIARTRDYGSYHVVYPDVSYLDTLVYTKQGTPVKGAYRSEENDTWLNQADIRNRLGLS